MSKRIALKPTTQQDVDDWIRFGTRIVRRKLNFTNLDPSDVLGTMYELSKSYNGEPDGFEPYAYRFFVWYYNRQTATSFPAYWREVPYRTSYLKEHPQDSTIDVDKFIVFMRERYKKYVSRNWVNSYLQSFSTALDIHTMEDRNQPHTTDTQAVEIDVALLTNALDLFCKCYPTMQSCTLYLESIIHPNAKPTLPDEQQLKQLLTFLHHQLPQQQYNALKVALLGE